MELELYEYKIDKVIFGEETKIIDNILSINKEELKQIINKDGFFSEIEIDIASPGSNTRIINIMDVMQPRCKESDSKSPYPGLYGTMHIAGEGRTYILDGVSVMQTGRRQGIQEGIVDMSGVGASYSLFSSINNIVLKCTPSDSNTSNIDFDNAIRK